MTVKIGAIQELFFYYWSVRYWIRKLNAHSFVQSDWGVCIVQVEVNVLDLKVPTSKLTCLVRPLTVNNLQRHDRKQPLDRQSTNVRGAIDVSPRLYLTKRWIFTVNGITPFRVISSLLIRDNLGSSTFFVAS